MPVLMQFRHRIRLMPLTADENIRGNCVFRNMYSETWGLGTLKGLKKTALNYEVVLFLRFISTYCIRTEVSVLNSQSVPISQVVLKTGFAVGYHKMVH